MLEYSHFSRKDSERLNRNGGGLYSLFLFKLQTTTEAAAETNKTLDVTDKLRPHARALTQQCTGFLSLSVSANPNRAGLIYDVHFSICGEFLLNFLLWLKSTQKSGAN